MNQPERDFLTWKDKHASLEKKHGRRSNVFSTIRVGLFLLAIWGVYMTLEASLYTYAVLLVIVVVVVFGILVRFHNRISFLKSFHHTLSQLNKEEIDRKQLAISSFEQGEEFIDDDHPYTSDLDIFGNKSIFQLINRSSLEGVKMTLASWLSTSVDEKTIKARQESIREMSEAMSWNQDFIALDRMRPEKNRLWKSRKETSPLELLLEWSKEEMPIARLSILRIATYVSNVLLFLLIALDQSGLVPLQPYLFVLGFVNVIILGTQFQRNQSLSRKLNGVLDIIKTYEYLISHVGQKTFQSQYLDDLRSKLFGEETNALKGISELKRVVNLYDSRSNVFYLLINIFILGDSHILLKTIRWRKKYASHINAWLDALHELGAIASLGAFRYANPDYVFPKVLERDFYLSTEAMGHPLISEGERVSNDYEIAGQGVVHLVTGSNMSGKSTFLRTLGVNIALAQTGAPVCARRFEWSLTDVFTSMRTSDDLSEHISSFYAELKRIKKMLDSINEKRTTFFMLDEILKGTNSADRNKGAEALIHQLHHKNAHGLISTHDLQLSVLEKETDYVKNYSFNSTVTGEEIRFDYAITDGPCKSFNASFLMRKMGIDIEANEKVLND